MFTAAQIIMPKSWKQSIYPSTVEWIKKIWYLFTVQYNSAIKKDKFEPFVGK